MLLEFKIKIINQIPPTLSLTKMPVVTRSAKKVSDEQSHMGVGYKFTCDIKQLLNDLENAQCKTAKMIISTEIFNKTNDQLETILRNNLNIPWVTFAAVVYNKTSEFEEQYKAKEFDNIKRIIVKTHAKEYTKARKFTASFLKNISNPIILKDEYIAETLTNIKKEETKNNEDDENEEEEFRRKMPYVTLRKPIIQKQKNILSLRGREIVRMN